MSGDRSGRYGILSAPARAEGRKFKLLRVTRNNHFRFGPFDHLIVRSRVAKEGIGKVLLRNPGKQPAEGTAKPQA